MLVKCWNVMLTLKPECRVLTLSYNRYSKMGSLFCLFHNNKGIINLPFGSSFEK